MLFGIGLLGRRNGGSEEKINTENYKEDMRNVLGRR